MTLHTIEEVGERLRTPVPTLRMWRSQGRGPAFMKLGKRLLCSEDELTRWIAEQQAAALAGR